MHPSTKDDGSPYYEYVLLYVDDVLVISEQGEHVLRNEIGKYFEMKEESIGPPTIYLGGKLSYVALDNGVQAWSFSSSQYAQAVVQNVEQYLAKSNRKLAPSAKTPFTSNYRPEIDMTDELDDENAAYYQSLIGILRWMVELGRVDICVEVSQMSSHLALPRKGHLDQLFHISSYLKSHHNSEMVFDSSVSGIDMNQFPEEDWTNTVYGGDLKEDLPPNMPEPRGIGFTVRVFVDSDHAGDQITRRSRTGFLVFFNSALIYLMYKKQGSIETSSFGSEYVAMKTATEYVRGLRFKLRMFGIPCEGCTYVYGDNKSVLVNSSLPHSTLKKKSNSIAYHFVRDGSARDEWRVTYIRSHDNPADLLTKALPSGEKRDKFVGMLMHHIV